MQIKNKKYLIIIFLLNFFLFISNSSAEEFNITAKEVVIDKDNEIIVGKGSVEVQDFEGKVIYTDKVTYNKSREFLLMEGNVEIADNKGNILKTSKATYDKLNEKILTYENSELILKDGYKLKAKNISYDVAKKILKSNENSIFVDVEGNTIETNMFQHDIENNLFSSIGKIKIIDINKNKYFFKEIHIDTQKKEMIGSDISVVLDQKNFGLSNKSDPRFVANDIFVKESKTTLSKGVFTVCQKRDDKCPPWSLKAKKIIHDQAKKIYIINMQL